MYRKRVFWSILFIALSFLFFIPSQNIARARSCLTHTTIEGAQGLLFVQADLTSDDIPLNFPSTGTLVVKNITLDSPSVEVPGVNLSIGEVAEMPVNIDVPGSTYGITLVNGGPATDDYRTGAELCEEVRYTAPGQLPPGVTAAPAKPKSLEPNAEIVEPKDRRVNGTMYQVVLKFNNLSPEDGYLVCLHSSGICSADQWQPIGDIPLESTSITLTVCGDGADAVKISEDGEDGDKCDIAKDYFHEGRFYRVSLARDDSDKSVLTSAQFYVHYDYPQVVLNEGQLKINAELSNDLRRTVRFTPSDATERWKGKEDANGNPLPGYLLTPVQGGAPLFVYLNTVIKAGGADRNNFQIVLKKDIGSYGEEQCVTAQNPEGDEASTDYVVFSYYGSSEGEEEAKPTLAMLTPGRYLLKIHEQNSEDSLGGLRQSDECQGGFAYYSIPLIVAPDSEGVNQLYVITDEVVADPEGAEYKKVADEYDLPVIPCAEWVNNKGEVTDNPNDFYECSKFETALGAFAIDPLDFIGDIMSWVIGFAVLGGLGLLIYSGYLLIYSRGDQEKITNAKDNIKAAIIGLIFLILSIAILEFIGVQILRIPGLGS